MIGQILGDYELQQEAGRGPAATVYVARQHPVERFVAVKVFEPQTREVAAGLKELYARLADLDHLHILPLYDHGRWQDRYYWVMRYMPAGSLKTRLRGARPTLEEIDRILPQIASALDYAHNHGVIHGDLKPSDVLIDHAGQAFVTDFGVGLALGRPASVTQAPELRHDHAPDARTDVYSLGALLYELLTLRPPIDPRIADEERTNRRLVPPAPSRLQSKIPAALDTVVLKALAVDPDQRYATPGELADAYVQARLGKKAAPVAVPVAVAALATTDSRVRRVSSRGTAIRTAPEQKNRGKLAGLIGGGLIGLLVIALLVWWLGRTPAILNPIATATLGAPTALPQTNTPTPQPTPSLAPSSSPTAAASPTSLPSPSATSTATLAASPTVTTRPPAGTPTRPPIGAPTRFIPTATPAVSIAPLTLAFPRSEGRDNLQLTFRTHITPANAGIIGTLSMAVPGVEPFVINRTLAQVGSGEQVLQVGVSVNCGQASGPLISQQIVLTLRDPAGKALLTQPVGYTKRWCE